MKKLVGITVKDKGTQKKIFYFNILAQVLDLHRAKISQKAILMKAKTLEEERTVEKQVGQKWHRKEWD